MPIKATFSMNKLQKRIQKKKKQNKTRVTNIHSGIHKSKFLLLKRTYNVARVSVSKKKGR